MKVNFKDFYNYSILRTDIKTPEDIATVTQLLNSAYKSVGMDKSLSEAQIKKLVDDPNSSLIETNRVTGTVELEIQTVNNKLDVMFDFTNEH